MTELWPSPQWGSQAADISWGDYCLVPCLAAAGQTPASLCHCYQIEEALRFAILMEMEHLHASTSAPLYPERRLRSLGSSTHSHQDPILQGTQGTRKRVEREGLAPGSGFGTEKPPGSNSGRGPRALPLFSLSVLPAAGGLLRVLVLFCFVCFPVFLAGST